MNQYQFLFRKVSQALIRTIVLVIIESYLKAIPFLRIRGVLVGKPFGCISTLNITFSIRNFI